MTTYNHAFAIAFTVQGSTTADGSEITAEQFRDAIYARVRDVMASGEMLEATGAPYDSFKETEVTS